MFDRYFASYFDGYFNSIGPRDIEKTYDDFLDLTETIVYSGTLITFTTKAGNTLNLPRPFASSLNPFDFINKYKIVHHLRYTIRDTVVNLREIKRYFNYNKYSPFHISDSGSRYLAYLESTIHNNRVLDMFKDDEEIILVFTVIPE